MVKPMSIDRIEGSNAGLAEVLDRILDKGIVIDAWLRVSVVGIDLITVDARVVGQNGGLRRSAIVTGPHHESHNDQRSIVSRVRNPGQCRKRVTGGSFFADFAGLGALDTLRWLSRSSRARVFLRE